VTDDEVLAAAQEYENSDLLTDRQKLALRLTDVYLRQPGVAPDDLRDQLRREFSPEQIIEILLRQVRYTWNKTLVALALDGESEPIAPG